MRFLIVLLAFAAVAQALVLNVSVNGGATLSLSLPDRATYQDLRLRIAASVGANGDEVILSASGVPLRYLKGDMLILSAPPDDGFVSAMIYSGGQLSSLKVDLDNDGIEDTIIGQTASGIQVDTTGDGQADLTISPEQLVDSLPRSTDESIDVAAFSSPVETEEPLSVRATYYMYGVYAGVLSIRVYASQKVIAIHDALTLRFDVGTDLIRLANCAGLFLNDVDFVMDTSLVQTPTMLIEVGTFASPAALPPCGRGAVQGGSVQGGSQVMDLTTAYPSSGAIIEIPLVMAERGSLSESTYTLRAYSNMQIAQLKAYYQSALAGAAVSFAVCGESNYLTDNRVLGSLYAESRGILVSVRPTTRQPISCGRGAVQGGSLRIDVNNDGREDVVISSDSDGVAVDTDGDGQADVFIERSRYESLYRRPRPRQWQENDSDDDLNIGENSYSPVSRRSRDRFVD